MPPLTWFFFFLTDLVDHLGSFSCVKHLVMVDLGPYRIQVFFKKSKGTICHFAFFNDYLLKYIIIILDSVLGKW